MKSDKISEDNEDGMKIPLQSKKNIKQYDEVIQQ